MFEKMQPIEGGHGSCLHLGRRKMAAEDQDHDWRIHLVAPLSERHYQRQGEKMWVLYEKGQGFA